MRHKQQKLLKQNAQNLEAYIKEHNLNKNQSNSCLITPESMILVITEADPDQNSFKNSKWLIKNLLNKNFLWEDIEAGKMSKAYDTLSRFLNIRQQWSESSIKDIQAYTGLSGIAEVIRPFEITKSMGELKREGKAKIYSETIVIYDKDNYLVVIPKTEEASCFWGRGTEWCTASTKSKNYFDYYNEYGPLIIAITPDNRKYQFHKNSKPMDENDQPLEDITDPVLVNLAWQFHKIGQINQDIRDKYFINHNSLNQYVQEHPFFIQYLPEELITLEICKLAVQNDGDLLKFIPKHMKDKENCELAVRNKGNSIKYISFKDFSKEDYFELCKLAVQQNGNAIYFIRSDIEDYFELCKLAVQQDEHAILFIRSDIEGYSELCKLAVQQNGYALKSIPVPHRTQELCELAVMQRISRTLTYVPDEYLNLDMCKKAFIPDLSAFLSRQHLLTHEICLLFVQKNGLSLSDIADNFKTADICLSAVIQNGEALRSVPKKYKTYEICEIAVKNYEWGIAFVPEDILTEELCKIVIKKNGYTLQFIPESFRTQELCIFSIPYGGKNIQYLEIARRTSEICKIALQHDGDALQYVPKDIITEELCEIAVQQNGYALHSVPELLKTERMCELAVANNQYAINFVPDKFMDNPLFKDIPQELPKSEITPVKWLENKDYEQIIENLNKTNSSKQNITLS